MVFVQKTLGTVMENNNTAAPFQTEYGVRVIIKNTKRNLT